MFVGRATHSGQFDTFREAVYAEWSAGDPADNVACLCPLPGLTHVCGAEGP